MYCGYIIQTVSILSFDDWPALFNSILSASLQPNVDFCSTAFVAYYKHCAMSLSYTKLRTFL